MTATPSPLLGDDDARLATAVLDAVGVALGLVLAAGVVFDLDPSVRWPVAAAFFVWVPGWALARLAGFRIGALSLLGAVGTSLALAFLVGQALVAWDWRATRAVVVLAGLAVAGVLAYDLREVRR